MKLHPLSAKAKELMLEMGAEACVIIIARPDASGDGWESISGAVIDQTHGLTWDVVGEMLAEASKDAMATVPTPEDEPS